MTTSNLSFWESVLVAIPAFMIVAAIKWFMGRKK